MIVRPPKKRRMVGWFNPIPLLQTAIRVLMSTIFGEFADKREALAAANPIDDAALDPSFDYEGRHPDGDFWFDFVADLGDGWNPTFAIARLLAEDKLPFAGVEDLPRGSLLIMGGDEVYPTPSADQYYDRLVYPYSEAYAERWKKEASPDLYAMPGNHDWYDGLRAFFPLFCRRSIKARNRVGVDRPGKVIGGRRTQQTRTYFALRLPKGWWLWGTDSQIEGYIDQPQVDFFQFVAEKWMAPKSRLILCAGTPDWEYVDPRDPEKKFGTLSYLARLAPSVGKGHELKLLLSGDSHHYARYHEKDLNFITCGGGGAFLHPTHNLCPHKKFEFPFPPPGQAYDPKLKRYARTVDLAKKNDLPDANEALFPSRAVSRRLARALPLFAVRNPNFTLVVAALYLIFTWSLYLANQILDPLSVHQPLQKLLLSGSLLCADFNFWRVAVSSPPTLLFCVLGLLCYYYFADADGLARIAMGSVHALVQAIAASLVACVVLRMMVPLLPGTLGTMICFAAAALVAAVATGTLMGFYLWLCLDAWGRHWGHFSALAVENYKSFLRLHIGSDGTLQVFAIGLPKVPNDRRRRSGKPEDLCPELIESISIR
jgi:Calcineurin-like phosphoesterase